jgi:hypothetical protein
MPLSLPDPAGVGDVELAERLAPAHDVLALDEPGGLVRALAGVLPAGGALAGALVLDVDDGQPQELDDGVVAGEVAAGLGDLAELVVQALDAYLELRRQPGLWSAASRRGQCCRRDARGLIVAVSASLIVTCSGPC